LADFDFDKAVRWARLGNKTTFQRREAADLPFVALSGPGSPLLLDSTVYIDRLQGRLPQMVKDLLETRLIQHSTVCMQELMYPIGRLDPRDERTAATTEAIGRAVRLMQSHRLVAPDPDMAGRGALMGGVLSRIRNYERGDTLRAVNDCILFLQAAKLGLTLLTRNISDFDYLLQMMPAGRVLFYRRSGEV